jgi:peroxiredoxin Q/BCP
MVDVGDKAPDFTLPSSTGESISLSKFLGEKNLVIFFYPMDESPVCSREAEAFRDNYEDFKQLHAEVIGGKFAKCGIAQGICQPPQLAIYTGE